MADITTTIPTVLKWTSKICWPLLRWYYTKERLEKFLLLEIPSTGDPLSYNFSSQEAICWLSATNLSPFDFTVDRIKMDVILNTGGSFSCASSLPKLIKGASKDRIYLRSSSAMTQQVAQSAKTATGARVTIEAHIITNIRSFNIYQHIEDVNHVRVCA